MTFPSTIRKLVIPAAGLGTRFLPATKVVPKELLPIAGKPLIQFAVEEAAASGIETVILVISGGKRLLAEHFHPNPHLENVLLTRGNAAAAELIRRLSHLTEIHTVWQDSPLGLADAIRCARSLVGDEPFAVILPDALIDSERPCISQLIDCYEKHPGCVIATRMLDLCDISRFGILDVIPMHDPGCGGAPCVLSLSPSGRPRNQPHRALGFSGDTFSNPQSFPALTTPAQGMPGNYN